MSGIAGIVQFDGGPVEPGLIENMTGAMAHRGPDGISHWVKGPVALGQCMLRTTPESLEERQPLANEDESVVLVMDGRMDNWEELRRELLGRGVRLRDRSDAELVLRAYEEWGSECLAHVDGDFAWVIWDGRRREAFCARDRMGNKPFYYHWDGVRLAVASEPQAILGLAWVKEELNEGMVAEHIGCEWYSREETLWKGVLRLPCGQAARVTERGLEKREYWRPPAEGEWGYRDEAEAAEAWREVLREAVRRTGRSGWRVGYEVSGGLDSTAVFALACGLEAEGRLGAPEMEGATLTFAGDRWADETELVRGVGRQVGKRVEEAAPSYPGVAWWKAYAAKYRELAGHPNYAMSLELRAGQRARGCRVVVTGQGGDEWAGGDRSYYREELGAGRLGRLGAWARADAAEYGWGWVGRRTLGAAAPAGLMRWRARRGQERERWGSVLEEGLQSALAERREAALKSPTDEGAARPGQRRLLHQWRNPLLAFGHEIGERMAAGSGLELRHPFRSRAVVEFAMGTPARLTLRGWRNKYLHREALRGWLPEEILERREKAEFTVAVRRCFEQVPEEEQDGALPEGRRWVAAERMRGLYRDFMERGQLDGDERAYAGQFPFWAAYVCGMVARSGRG